MKTEGDKRKILCMRFSPSQESAADAAYQERAQPWNSSSAVAFRTHLAFEKVEPYVTPQKKLTERPRKSNSGVPSQFKTEKQTNLSVTSVLCPSRHKALSILFSVFIWMLFEISARGKVFVSWFKKKKKSHWRVERNDFAAYCNYMSYNHWGNI